MSNLTRAALFSTLSSLALVASPAFAQDAPPAAPVATPDPAPDAAIIVTGTRRTDRTVADSPVPVDVIGAEAIQNSGQTETNKILNNLVPSFNFPQPSIADGTDALRPATLRGLSPDQTLVLVNGKRRHVSALLNINGTVGRGSAAVDLNMIPGMAISRVEVLRDGASSQYGSDAIAGVINIQLRGANHGGRVTATYGRYHSTLNDVANITGLQTSGGQPVLDPTDNRVFAATADGERHARDGQTYTLGANIGVPLGPNGFVNLTAEYRDRNPTNRAGYDLRPNYNRPAPPPSTRASSASTASNSAMATPRRRTSTCSSIRASKWAAAGNSTCSVPTASATGSAPPTTATRTPRPTATSALSCPTRRPPPPISCR